MKYLFYLAVLLFIYRALFRPKVIVEHRHFYDKKQSKQDKKTRLKDSDYTDYEEIS